MLTRDFASLLAASRSSPPTFGVPLEQLKRVRESEKQCKPLLDKNKLLNKRNDELTLTIQKLEEKAKNLAKENLEMVRTESHEYPSFL